VHFDDIVDKIHPDCRNLDIKKINKWAIAAFGAPLDKLGKDSITMKMEQW